MYILKNLRSLIRNSKTIFLLLVICVIASTLVIQFSYGIYQNYNVVIEHGESEYKQISIDFDNKADNYVKSLQVLACVEQFSKNLYSGIDFCTLTQDQQVYRDTYDNMDIVNDKEGNLLKDPARLNYFYFSFNNDGKLTDSKTIKNNMQVNNFLEGRWFRKEEWLSAAKVCIVGLGNSVQRVQPYTDENGDDVYYISHDGVVDKNVYTDEFGDQYKIIGVSQIGGNIYPISTVNQDYRIDNFYFELFQPITYEQYKELSDILESKLGDYIDMPEVKFTDSKNLYLYKTIIMICGLISIAAGINFIILFHFIMMKRRKKIAIFRLCGCSLMKCILMCISECLIITIPLYILSTIVFDKIVVPLFGNTYPYMQSANSVSIYIILGLFYIGITTLITLAMLIKSIVNVSINSLQKGMS